MWNNLTNHHHCCTYTHLHHGRETRPLPVEVAVRLKRPGAASRISVAEREAARRQQLEREAQAARTAQQEAASRGVHDVVKQHYNMVPERGREWRQTDSKIKGLRSYNNWVKSSLIQKFIGEERNLKILDIGCGKGGDLLDQVTVVAPSQTRTRRYGVISGRRSRGGSSTPSSTQRTASASGWATSPSSETSASIRAWGQAMPSASAGAAAAGTWSP